MKIKSRSLISFSLALIQLMCLLTMLLHFLFLLQNAVVRPPFFMQSWIAIYLVNIFIVIWTVVIGIGWGGWASVTTFKDQIKTFGVFAPCYQCPPTAAPAPALSLNITHHN